MHFINFCLMYGANMTVTIFALLDKLRVSPPDQAIREGTTLQLKFTLDRPLLTQTDMLVPWRYQYKVYSDVDKNMFIDRKSNIYNTICVTHVVTKTRNLSLFEIASKLLS